MQFATFVENVDAVYLKQQRHSAEVVFLKQQNHSAETERIGLGLMAEIGK